MNYCYDDSAIGKITVEMDGLPGFGTDAANFEVFYDKYYCIDKTYTAGVLTCILYSFTYMQDQYPYIRSTETEFFGGIGVTKKNNFNYVYDPLTIAADPFWYNSDNTPTV
jgi:hypothetical protein